MESRVEDIDQDIRLRCALCKTMDCCPEHCCNWDTCRCSDCEYCKANSHQHSVGAGAILANPEIYIKATGTEQITKVGVQKKKQPKNKWQQDSSDEEEDQEQPHELYRAQDGALIKNYEIGGGAVEQQEEDDGKLSYAGGVRGIRALRKQRDNLPDVEPTSQSTNQTQGVPFNQKYEESKR